MHYPILCIHGWISEFAISRITFLSSVSIKYISEHIHYEALSASPLARPYCDKWRLPLVSWFRFNFDCQFLLMTLPDNKRLLPFSPSLHLSELFMQFLNKYECDFLFQTLFLISRVRFRVYTWKHNPWTAYNCSQRRCDAYSYVFTYNLFSSCFHLKCILISHCILLCLCFFTLGWHVFFSLSILFISFSLAVPFFELQ